MSSFKVWKYHHSNSDLLEIGFTTTTRYCKEFIRQGRQREADSQTRLAAVNLAALFESRLMELIFHEDSAVYADRGRILACATMSGTWRKLVDEGFAQLEGIRLSLVPRGLRSSNKSRHTEIITAIDDHVVPLIELRNALAHGGWEYTLTDDRMTVSQTKMQHLRTTSLWHLQVQHNLFGHLYKAVYDLLIAKSFERDFDKHFNNLHAATARLKRNGSKDWEAMLQRRWQRRPARMHLPPATKRAIP
ncbi:hypothetical protein SAMN05421837_12057 [Amycolatopsis pretoriensis]|uniref:Uncharacterized protein n=1 Tax=Amycolatopsis pretoriensis TaxID=218821 RepID=A0A1H5RIZ6_9PSEU|nr:hypothetical protein [Amycolatopsis pretoriensis]SEF38332.1 hypothetical protein SAMN05421837_12057 [Amycolatopsis pretoriensis]